MKIEQQLLASELYGEKRNKKDIKYIVVQDIGNKHSPHYIVYEGKAIQKIPDDYASDSVNGCRLNRFGYLHGICTKYNSISIGIPSKMLTESKEMCVNLIMTLKQRYKISDDNIIRQMDITGELNPVCWHEFKTWERDVINKLIEI